MVLEIGKGGGLEDRHKKKVKFREKIQRTIILQ